jgi:hypothetical protein
MKTSDMYRKLVESFGSLSKAGHVIGLSKTQMYRRTHGIVSIPPSEIDRVRLLVEAITRKPPRNENGAGTQS